MVLKVVNEECRWLNRQRDWGLEVWVWKRVGEGSVLRATITTLMLLIRRRKRQMQQTQCCYCIQWLHAHSHTQFFCAITKMKRPLHLSYYFYFRCPFIWNFLSVNLYASTAFYLRFSSDSELLFWQTMKSEVLIAVTLNKGDCCGLL